MSSDRPIHLDASVIIGLLSDDDAHNEAVRDALKRSRRERERFAISAAAYAETLALPALGGPASTRQAKDSIARLCDGEPVPFDGEAAEQAARLRAKHEGLRTLDAMILASAKASGAKHLLTTDKRLARLPGVRYVGRSQADADT